MALAFHSQEVADFGQETAVVVDAEELRKRVQDALRRATGPMHVPQPDGSTLRLCYTGRLTRAMALLHDATPERQAVIQQAMHEIAEEARQAWRAYQSACVAYSFAGGNTESITERPCRCDVCADLVAPTVTLYQTDHTENGVP